MGSHLSEDAPRAVNKPGFETSGGKVPVSPIKNSTAEQQTRGLLLAARPRGYQSRQALAAPLARPAERACRGGWITAEAPRRPALHGGAISRSCPRDRAAPGIRATRHSLRSACATRIFFILSCFNCSCADFKPPPPPPPRRQNPASLGEGCSCGGRGSGGRKLSH